eukprot:1803031-Alexandrium_andersonii.AAC.1
MCIRDRVDHCTLGALRGAVGHHRELRVRPPALPGRGGEAGREERGPRAAAQLERGRGSGGRRRARGS